MIPTHPPSPRTKALPFEGSKKVPSNHPYSTSVSSSAKWANAKKTLRRKKTFFRTTSEVCFLKTTLS